MKRHNGSLKVFQREDTKVVDIKHERASHRPPSAWVNPQGLLILDLDGKHLAALKRALQNEAHALFCVAVNELPGSAEWREARELSKVVESVLDAVVDAQEGEVA